VEDYFIYSLSYPKKIRMLLVTSPTTHKKA